MYSHENHLLCLKIYLVGSAPLLTTLWDNWDVSRVSKYFRLSVKLHFGSPPVQSRQQTNTNTTNNLYIVPLFLVTSNESLITSLLGLLFITLKLYQTCSSFLIELWSLASFGLVKNLYLRKRKQEPKRQKQKKAFCFAVVNLSWGWESK